jgi:membrane fusion protein, multidrug efflux system
MTAPLDPAPAGQKPRKRTVAFLVFLGVVAVAAIGGLLYWRYASQFEDTDDAIIDGNIVAVSPQISGRVSVVHVKDNQDVRAGDLLVEIDPTDYVNAVKQAKARVDVAQTSADLVRVSTAAQITQAKAGVSTAQAAVATAQAAVKQAQAAIEHAQAGVTQAQATVTGAQAQVASSQADVAAAQAEATRRAADVKRYEAVDPRALSQQMLDAARAAAEASAAQLSAAQKRKLAADAQVEQDQSKLLAARAAQSEAEAALVAAASNVDQAKSRVDQAQGVLETANTAKQQIDNALAQVEAAQAALDSAQQQLAYTKIVAPVAGRVTRKGVQPGQVVDAGRNLLAIVEPGVWVTANFKETQLTRMHAGQAVDIRVDTYPGRVFKGKIDSFQSGTGARFSLMPPENATGNFVKVVQRVPVKIVFADDAGAKMLLGPGMSVVPRVRVAGDEGTPAPIARLGAGAN